MSDVRILILVSAGIRRRKKHCVTLSSEAYKVVEGETEKGAAADMWRAFVI